jgi:type IX secretion system PorP/SprF family membrane protein
LKALLATCFFIFLALADISAQDPLFSQYNASPLFVNPAFAGTSQITRFSLCYRNQNLAMGSSYVSYYASYDQYIELFQGGIGFNILHDVQENGMLRLLSADAIYAYSIMVNPKLTVSAGIQASYSYRSMQTGSLRFTDGVDPVDGSYTVQGDNSLHEQKGYPDVAVGFLGITRFSYLGFAAHHLNMPNMSFQTSRRVPLPWKFTLHGGTVLPLYERRFGREALRLNPNIVLTYQGGHSQFNYGLDIWAGSLYVGLWGRQHLPLTVSSVIVTGGYSGDWFRVGYSYDFSILSPYMAIMNSGAHEISFSLKLSRESSQRMKRKTIKVPII